jgi:hypothetical protein
MAAGRQAVAGGEVEEGLQLGPGDADLAAGAGRQIPWVVGAQDALHPLEARRRQLAGGGTRGVAPGLEAARRERDGQRSRP